MNTSTYETGQIYFSDVALGQHTTLNWSEISGKLLPDEWPRISYGMPTESDSFESRICSRVNRVLDKQFFHFNSNFWTPKMENYRDLSSFTPVLFTFQIFTGNSDRNTVKVNVLDVPIYTRYIRLHPKSFHAHISLRLDLYGCKTGR